MCGRSLSFIRVGSAAVLAVLLSACSDPLSLPPATDPNVVDTLTLDGLSGTDIGIPSGYDMANLTKIRTDRASPFDFAFDIDTSGVSKIFPTGALGIGGNSGVLYAETSFERVDDPPLEGYVTDSALVIDVDSVFIVRGRPAGAGIVPCPFFLGSLPRYGKFRVLAIDPQVRQVTLESLINVNCGYRRLQPGFPDS
jgi:hypothetical protein